MERRAAMMVLMPCRKPQPPALKTERLRLRPFSLLDAARLSRITSDLHITRNLMKTTTPFSQKEARRLILRVTKKRSPVWAIDNGQLIGLIGLSGEFGFWLARSAWGQGYATEAGRAVIDHAFSQGATVLNAHPIADNQPSRHCLEKLGFQQQDFTTAFCRERGKHVPVIHYSLHCNG